MDDAAATPVRFTVNGVAAEVRVHPMARLLDVLREQLRLTGTKEGCGEGECGACSVLLDGELVNSCLVPMVQVAGARVVTIEGIQEGDRLHPVQEAFLTHGGAQCGICTPGMVMAAVHLLSRHATPSVDQVREGLAGNLCRCTGYTKILEAVLAASGNVPQPTAGPLPASQAAQGHPSARETQQQPSSRGAQRRSDLGAEIAMGPAGPRDDAGPAGPRDDA